MDIINELKDLKQSLEPLSKETIDKIKGFNRVIIWGGGLNAKKALGLLNKNGILVNCFYDDSTKKQGKLIDGVEICKPNIENLSDCALIIACNGYISIRERLYLCNKNIDNNLFLFEAHEIEEDYSIDYLNKNSDKINNVYSLLKDEKSKNIFLNLIKFRYTRDERYLNGIVDSIDDQYFDEVMLNNFKEGYIIDAGVFLGELADGFRKYSCLNFEKNYFYAFEPDLEICELLRQKTKSLENYKIFPLALFDKKGTIKFNPSPTGAGTVNEEGNVIIDTDCLDNIVTNENITFIKMDIEGSELSALKGAKECIVKNMPLCAISAYHKRDDLWNIILYFDSLDLNYEYYIRHYTYSLSETVLYCVPVSKD